MSDAKTLQLNTSGCDHRECLQKGPSSPEASLLLNIGMCLTKEDVSNIKLLMLVDSHVKKREIELLKTGSELVTHLFARAFISKANFEFLKMLVDNVGRKDLCVMIEAHEKKNRIRKETTPPVYNTQSELVTNSTPVITSNTPYLHSCGSIVIDTSEDNEITQKVNQQTNIIDDDVLMSSQNSGMSIDSSDDESSRRSLLCEADSTSTL